MDKLLYSLAWIVEYCTIGTEAEVFDGKSNTRGCSRFVFGLLSNRRFAFSNLDPEAFATL